MSADIRIAIDTAIEVQVNILPLTDDTDFKTRETAVAWNAAGMDLVWNFITTAGVVTQTAVTPTNPAGVGDYDWNHVGDGIYKIEIPASGGASIDNDAEGYGWFTGFATGILPWRGPLIEFLAVDNFPATHQQVANIGSGGSGATNHEMTNDNVLGALTYGGAFVGVEAAGTFVTTASDPSTYHQIDHAGNAINIVYYTNVGGNREAISILFQGYLDRIGREGVWQAYDFVGAGWDTIYTLEGQTGTDNVVEPPMRLLSKHTGTGLELGDVYIRFVTAAQPQADLFNAVLLVEAVNTSDSVGYSDGSIWVDTVNGTAGSIPFTNGTADNPVLTWADALLLSAPAGLNIKRFHIINGSTITLTANTDNYTLIGDEWILALAGQSCDNASFTGAHVTGICTGGEVVFRDCDLAAGGGTLTCAGLEAHDCAIAGDIVLTAANTYFMDKCYSAIAGTDTPSIDFGAAVGDTNLNMRHYSGGIEIKNMGQVADDTMSLEAFGQLIINANCDPSTNPVIAIRGHLDLIDNVAGGFVAGGGVISDMPRFASDDLVDDIWDDPDAALLAKEGTVTAGFAAGAKEVTLTSGFVAGAKELTVVNGFAAGAKEVTLTSGFLAGAKELTVVNGFAADIVILNQIKGAVAGKVVRNATGTVIEFYDVAGVLFSTVTLTGSTWNAVFV